MALIDRIMGNGLLLTKPVPSVTKAKGPGVATDTGAITTVGVLLVALVVLAIVLYAMTQPEAGRLVIDLAIAFLAWVAGRKTGEEAGAKQSAP